MRVTAVEIKLIEPGRGGPELLAFANVILDDELLIHDCRLIRAAGKTFVVFPDVERTRYCPRCGRRVKRSANFCNECGNALPPPVPLPSPPNGEMPLGEFRDVVHPIRSRLRREITEAVIAQYTEECQRCRPQQTQQVQTQQPNSTTTT